MYIHTTIGVNLYVRFTTLLKYEARRIPSVRPRLEYLSPSNVGYIEMMCFQVIHKTWLKFLPSTLSSALRIPTIRFQSRCAHIQWTAVPQLLCVCNRKPGVTGWAQVLLPKKAAPITWPGLGRRGRKRMQRKTSTKYSLRSYPLRSVHTPEKQKDAVSHTFILAFGKLIRFSLGVCHSVVVLDYIW